MLATVPPLAVAAGSGTGGDERRTVEGVGADGRNHQLRRIGKFTYCFGVGGVEDEPLHIGTG